MAGTPEKQEKVYSVISKTEFGFNRSGRRFTPTPTIIRESEMSKDKLQAILDEQMLIIRELSQKEIEQLSKKESKPEDKK